MNLTEADKLFATPARTGALEKALKDKKCRKIFLGGLPGSSPAMLFAGLSLPKKSPLLIVAEDFDSAGYIYHDLCQVAGEKSAAIFPSGYKRAIKYGQPDPPQQILRTETLDRLRRDDGLRFVVTCPEALAEKVADHEGLATASIELKKNGRMLLSDLAVRLRELGFRETEYFY